MFRTVKLRTIRRAALLVFFLLLIAVISVLIAHSGAPDTVTVNEEAIDTRAKTDADLAAFLDSCGYDDAALMSERAVTVPKHWNETYCQYNETQRGQGFDLLPYKGKEARELTYTSKEGYLTLLVCGGRIIAAHMSDGDGGEARPLIR